MKKLLTLIALILVAFSINAQNTCGTAIPLNTCMEDSAPANGMKWYSFVAGGSRQTIQVIGLASSPAHINNISLYSSCSGIPIAQVNASGPLQDTLILTDSTLTPSSTYYVSLNNTPPAGCVSCPNAEASYNVCRIGVGFFYPCVEYDYSGIQCYTGSSCTADGLSNSYSCGGICAGTVVTFPNQFAPSETGFGIYSIASSTFIYTDMNPSNPSFSYTFLTPGQYTIGFITGPALSPSFILGWDGMITIVPIPTPAFTITPNPVCPGDIVTLTRTDPIPPGQSWAWVAGNASGYYLYIPNPSSGPPISPTYSFVACENLQPGTNQIGLLESNGGTVFEVQGDQGYWLTSGCLGITYQNVILDNFQPTFTYTYPCNGGPVAFTNTSSCPEPSSANYTWLWDFGDHTTSTAANPLPHLYTSAGTYTVTLYSNTVDQNNFCASYYNVPSIQQTITIYPPLNITITGNNLACLPGNTYCATVSGGSGNYTNGTWSVTNGTFVHSATCNGINATIPSVADGGTVYYTVTDAITGCTHTDSVVVMGCCPREKFPVPNVLEDESLSSLGGVPPFPVGSWTDSYNGTRWTFANFNGANPFVINGILTVDQDMTILNSDVELGTNAQIQITPGHHLLIENSYLHACADMWNGIYVQAGATLTIGAKTLIEDAQRAVVSVGGGNYDITNTIFNKDYKGIVVEAYNGAHPALVYRSTFACNTSAWPSLVLGAPTTLLAPDIGVRTNMGVEVDNVNSITIGKVGVGSGNTFMNLDYGVNSNASTTTVINNTFDDNAPALPGIIGVYTKGDPYGTYSANIGTSSANTFNNWGTGVFVRDTMNANVENNSFNNNAQGIQAWNTLHNKLQLNKNTMSNVSFIGINAYNNLTSSVYMLNNNIAGSFISRFAPTGIYINEIAVTVGTHYFVETNVISRVINGVYSSNLYNSFILDNNIFLVRGSIGFNEGIYTAGSFASDIQHNNVLSLAGANSEDGIYVNGGSGNNQVLCNTTTGSNNGIVFAGPSVSTNMVQNDMTLNTNGLLLLPSATIGTQGASGTPNDNQWFFCINSTNAILPTTIFEVRSPINTSYWPTNNIGGGINFSGTSGASCFDCATGGGCLGGTTAAAALQVSTGATPFISFPSTSHWLEKHSLFKYLNSVDSSLLSNATIRHFRDSAASANMGRLETISALMADSNGVSPTEIVNATNLNNSLVSPDTAEQTAQTVNAIAIAMQSAGRNLPTAAQKTALQTIAPLCPALYGNAVFIARALLSQVDSNIYVSSCEMYADSTHGHHHGAIKPESKDSLVTAKVYPNPANTLLNADVELQAGQVAYLELYNSLGQKMQNAELKNSHSTLNISSLSAGMYYYRILDNNGNLILADKLTIIH